MSGGGAMRDQDEQLFDADWLEDVRRDMVRVVLDNASEASYQARYTAPATGDLFAGDANTS